MQPRIVRWFSIGLIGAGFSLFGATKDAQALLQLASSQGLGVNLSSGGVGEPAFYDAVIFFDNNLGGAVGSVIPFDGGYMALIQPDRNDTVSGSLVISGSATDADVPVTVGGFRVTGSASQSTSPGTTAGPLTFEVLTSTSLTVENISGGALTQRVVVTDNNYKPLVNGVMISTVGGVITGGGSVTVTTTDNGANRLYAGTVYDSPAGPGPTTFGYNGAVFTDAYSDDVTVPIGFTATMSKSIEFDIALDPGAVLSGRLNQITNIGIAAAVPEPTTLAMAFAGLPVFAGCWLRRRRQQA